MRNVFHFMLCLFVVPLHGNLQADFCIYIRISAVSAIVLTIVTIKFLFLIMIMILLLLLLFFRKKKKIKSKGVGDVPPKVP